MGYNEYDAQQQLRSANRHLRQIRDELWLANQPPDVRARVQRERASRETAGGVLLLLFVAVGLAWGAVHTLFGARAAGAFTDGVFWLLGHGLEWAVVLGLGLWVWSAVSKARRVLGGPAPDRRVDSPPNGE